MRLSEWGHLHRNERSGTLSGLTRVRHFVQDDAHCYVRPDQLADEIEGMLGEIAESYSWFGLVPRFSFATRPDKALGDLADWERAEGLMKDALDRAGVEYTIKPKDGTFYAPKIDIYIDDALGREWQMATIQADMMMLPERFDLTYIDEDGQPQRPIAVHRAIYGSLERFIGIITEHFAGAFPFWCAPLQAVIVPIADRHIAAAQELATVLRARKLFVEVDDSSNRMQKKIKLAQDQKVPYMLVLGDREVDGRTAAPRTRTGEQLEPTGWEELAERLAEQAASRRPD
jgi:threonyl-tRNA synthetase